MSLLQSSSNVHNTSSEKDCLPWRVEDARGEVAAGGEELLEVEATARGREAGWWRTAVDLVRGRTELSAEVTLLGGAQGRVVGGTGVGGVGWGGS